MLQQHVQGRWLAAPGLSHSEHERDGNPGTAQWALAKPWSSSRPVPSSQSERLPAAATRPMQWLLC
jgi:hypothetical protein